MREQIEHADSEIGNLNDSIGRILNHRNEYCIRLLGLENKIACAGEDSEVMEYFLCNDKLYLEEVTNTDMYFVAGDYLTYFDKECAENTIANKRSFVYGYDSSRAKVSADEMEKLMTAIFIDETLRIKVCAAYRFSLAGNVSPNGDHSFPSEYSTYMQNPHIQLYTCMGNYTRSINDLLRKNDYIGALEQSVASCKSLNWADSTVMADFMAAMYGVGRRGLNTKCIELPDGSVVKPEQAVQWLVKQEEQTDAETKEEA